MRVCSDTTQTGHVFAENSPQSIHSPSLKKAGKKLGRSNTFNSEINVDTIPEEEEISTPVARRSDTKFLTQEIKELEVIEEKEEASTQHPRQAKVLHMQFEDEPEGNEEETTTQSMHESRVKGISKKHLASILDEKQYYSDNQLRRHDFSEDSCDLTQKPSSLENNGTDNEHGEGRPTNSSRPKQLVFIDESYLSCEDYRSSDLSLQNCQSEESDDHQEYVRQRNYSIGSNTSASKSRFYVERKHSFSRFSISKEGNEDSRNEIEDDDSNTVERPEGKRLTSPMVDNRLSTKKRESVNRYGQRKQIITKLKESRKALSNAYAKMEICDLIKSASKEFASQSEFNIRNSSY